MNDAHVESLKYTLKLPEHVVFENPPPIDGETSEFAWALGNNLLTVTMKDHYANEDSARDMVEPFLRKWELDAGLRFGGPSLDFRLPRRCLSIGLRRRGTMSSRFQ